MDEQGGFVPESRVMDGGCCCAFMVWLVEEPAW